MSANVTILSKSELCGREFTVYGTPEAPLFLAKEVAEIIGHSDSNKMIQSVDEEEKVRNIVPTLGGPQEMWLLTEDGLYEVLMQSRKPIAKTFKKGTKKILRELRTNGGYIVTTKEDTPEMILARAVKVADATIRRIQEENKLLSVTNTEQAHQIEEMKPKVDYCDNVLNSKDAYNFTIIAKSLGFRSAHAMTEDLILKGIVYRSGEDVIPRANYSDKGYFKSHTYAIDKPYFKGTKTKFWITEKGKYWLHNEVYNTNNIF